MNVPDPALMVQSFAHNTRVNLEFIELNQEKFGARIYEITQLLNSMLGLLIFPVERLLEQIKIEKNTNELAATEISYKFLVNKQNSEIDDYVNLLTKLRHAFAHGNVHLGDSGQIKSIQFWNYPQGKKRIPENENWRIEIKPSELRRLVLTVCDILERDLPNIDRNGSGILSLREKPDLLAEGAA